MRETKWDDGFKIVSATGRPPWAVKRRLFADERISEEQLQSLVAGIAAFVAAAHLVKVSKSVVLCRDPEEDMVLDVT